MPGIKNGGGYMLTWSEDQPASIGEGISRTSNPSARLFEVSIKFGGALPMTDHIRALNKGQAAMFAKNRYPTATKINVIGRSSSSAT